VPKVHIRDFFVHCCFDDNYQDAILKTQIKLWNYGHTAANGLKIEILLLDDEQENAKLASESLNIDVNAEKIIELHTEIESPKKWSAEIPNLI
jgi:beta-galactosidase